MSSSDSVVRPFVPEPGAEGRCRDLLAVYAKQLVVPDRVEEHIEELLDLEGGFVDSGRTKMSTSLYKHDYATGSSTVAPLDPELLIGEMSFVPRPGGESATPAEDDGILIGYGYHRARDEGQLVLLDAQTCESVATVHLPQRVPMGFHGNWAPRD